MAKQILILTASPERDAGIDELLAMHLKEMGNEVTVQPCLRGGREKILELKPNVVVTPPIKNPHARDTATLCKYWGMGLVVRNTEASFDWTDFKAMNAAEKTEAMGPYPYPADVELVWGPDEAEILNRRGSGFRTLAVGCFVADVCKSDALKAKFQTREQFDKSMRLRPGIKTMVWATCWGFADTAPDLQVDEMTAYAGEKEAREQWIDAIAEVWKACGDDWNIVVKMHPNEKPDEYRAKLPPGVIISTGRKSVETLLNTDLLIHAGSTMAAEAHLLDKPAVQFKDVHKLYARSWFTRQGPMSRISPLMETKEAIVKYVKEEFKAGTNANLQALDELERGRFGPMDGKATLRAAQVIHQIQGEFVLRWPVGGYDYNQPQVKKRLSDFATAQVCGVCKQQFFIGLPPPSKFMCPNCGCQIFGPVAQ